MKSGGICGKITLRREVAVVPGLRREMRGGLYPLLYATSLAEIEEREKNGTICEKVIESVDNFSPLAPLWRARERGTNNNLGVLIGKAGL